MRIIIETLHGYEENTGADATIFIYNKQGLLIHTEGFTGKIIDGAYEREIPVTEAEYMYSSVVISGVIDYRVSV